MPSPLDRARRELAPVRRAVGVGALPAAVWAVWASGPGWATPAFVVLACVGVALAVVDLRTHRLPDALTRPGTALVVVLLGVAALATGDGPALVRALAGGLALGAVYLLLHLVHRAGMGLGDVKLAVLLGVATGWAGWATWAAAALLPFLLGGLAALVLLATRRASRTTAIAFGPFMLAGAAVALTAARLA
ncbi:prepilin peptidase [Isoptericola sp. NPDC057653]|uniref:prepilin peptidase n=1 Tax=Isoptericola sp. NPDC057653 TaxID=3346195 RepID=UPI0036C824DF